jgi:hypothetical protein
MSVQKLTGDAARAQFDQLAARNAASSAGANQFLGNSSAPSSTGANQFLGNSSAPSSAGADQFLGESSTPSSASGKGTTYLNGPDTWLTGILDPAKKDKVIPHLGLFDNAFNMLNQAQATNSGMEAALMQSNAMLNGAGIQAAPGALTQDVHAIVRNQYANLFVNTANNSINCAVGSIANGLAGAEAGIASSLGQAVQIMHDKFKPVNKFIGSTLYGLTGMLRDPLGAHGIIPTIGGVINKVNPKFAQSHEASFLAIKMEEISHLPGNIYGSIQHLQSAMAGGKLFGPVQFIKDMYLGAMNIIKSIGKFINDLFYMLQKFVFMIINELIPLNMVLGFLQAVTQIAGSVGSIASAFGGLNQITQFTSQLTNVTGQLGSIISNPAALAARFLPPQVQQGMAFLNNPEALVSALPPPFSTILCILNKISGYGYNYNMGYGLTTALDQIKGGVLAGIIGAFSSQFQILNSIFKPTAPPVPPAFSYKYNNVSAPGRPNYNTDRSGQVVKDPCLGAPKAPYSLDPATSTANAPSNAADAQKTYGDASAAATAAADKPFNLDYSNVTSPIEAATLSPVELAMADNGQETFNNQERIYNNMSDAAFNMTDLASPGSMDVAQPEPTSAANDLAGEESPITYADTEESLGTGASATSSGIYNDDNADTTPTPSTQSADQFLGNESAPSSAGADQFLGNSSAPSSAGADQFLGNSSTPSSAAAEQFLGNSNSTPTPTNPATDEFLGNSTASSNAAADQFLGNSSAQAPQPAGSASQEPATFDKATAAQYQQKMNARKQFLGE